MVEWKPSDAMRVHERLRELLVDSPGSNVTNAALDLGMSRPALSNVLNGNADLSISLALKIEALLKISTRQLLIDQMDEQIACARKEARAPKRKKPRRR